MRAQKLTSFFSILQRVMNRILARGLVGQRAVSIADEEECGIVFVRVFVMATAEDRRLKCQLVIKPSAMVSILKENGGKNYRTKLILRVTLREVANPSLDLLLRFVFVSFALPVTSYWNP